MDVEEFKTLGHALVDRLADYLSESADGPVLARADPVEIDRHFEERLPSSPLSAEDLLQEVERSVFPFATNLSSPGYLGLITPSPLPIGALGDLVASTLNQNVGAWTIGPGAVSMERQVVRWLADLVGYGPDAGGHLVSGGMAANLTGLKLARDWATGDRAQHDGIAGRYAVYVSEERHVSIDKAVDAVGLGRNALRALPTDDRLSLRIDALEEAVERDKRDGVRPLCIVCLSGTTNTGSVDDVRALRAVADRESMWLHADAAYGGGMLLSERTPGLMDGLELADSVTIDPHKWFFAPLDAGAIVVRDARRLSKSFGLKPSYLTDEFDRGRHRFNFYEHGMEQSKRFRALKVWMIFKRYGSRQIGRWIDANVEAVQDLHALVERSPRFEPACFPLMSAYCFRFAPEGIEEPTLARVHAEVAEAVERDGRFWIGTTTLKGKAHFRLCAVNLSTTLAHLEALFELVGQECERRLAQG